MTKTIPLSFLAFILSISSMTSIASSKAAGQLPDNLPAYSIEYNPQFDAFKDGAAAVDLASKTNRRILVELGGDWCKWCHIMDDFFDKNPDLKQQLHETFVILKVNVSDANNNSEFLKAFPKPLGYPHMYVSESNGSVLWSKDTAEFVENGQYSRQRFIEFFDRWHIKNKK